MQDDDDLSVGGLGFVGPAAAGVRVRFRGRDRVDVRVPAVPFGNLLDVAGHVDPVGVFAGDLRFAVFDGRVLREAV